MPPKRPFSDILMGFTQLLILTSLIVSPSPYRRLLFIPISTFIFHLIYLTSKNNPAKDNIMGSVLATYLLTASDYILLTDVQRVLRRVGEKVPISGYQITEKIEVLRPKPTFTERIQWGVKLFASPRGIGWTHKPTQCLRNQQPLGRYRFIQTQLLWALLYALLFDIAGIYRRWAISTQILGPDATGSHLTWTSFIFWKSLEQFAFVVTTVSHMCNPHNLLSALAVWVGISKQEDWPHLFGNWKEAYTIRRFWGRVWHQLMRRPLTTHCRYISNNLFRIPRGTLRSSYAQLALAWAISSLVHGAGEFMAF
ncbi:hypothetical protein BDN72DRAFT_832577 [Pluteus cervinus]|uniref:Uncharacterized protein n=1 Tax=Pluteus cervinus TaxID=181527 RepID=A0ACD3BBB1_9AGAR|nr:hypothetical protein BDN72DRAFT_832577 [Pluteus cervinus]